MLSGCKPEHCLQAGANKWLQPAQLMSVTQLTIIMLMGTAASSLQAPSFPIGAGLPVHC